MVFHLGFTAKKPYGNIFREKMKKGRLERQKKSPRKKMSGEKVEREEEEEEVQTTTTRKTKGRKDKFDSPRKIFYVKNVRTD